MLSYKEIIKKRRDRTELWKEIKKLNRRETNIINNICRNKRNYNSDMNTDLQALMLCRTEREETLTTLAKMEKRVRKGDRRKRKE